MPKYMRSYFIIMLSITYGTGMVPASIYWVIPVSLISPVDFVYLMGAVRRFYFFRIHHNITFLTFLYLFLLSFYKACACCCSAVICPLGRTLACNLKIIRPCLVYLGTFRIRIRNLKLCCKRAAAVWGSIALKAAGTKLVHHFTAFRHNGIRPADFCMAALCYFYAFHHGFISSGAFYFYIFKI